MHVDVRKARKEGEVMRTYHHLADPAKGQDEYFVDDIIATAMRHGKRHWLVRWKGYGPDADTWEPLAHLAGAGEYIAFMAPRHPTLRPCN
eukprot:8128314-Pyramimonas_sp.AAC.1